MIFSKEPENWEDLEAKVASILKSVGFSVKNQYDIETARGSVNIDVYAIKNNLNPPILCLCECKYLKISIPKSIIHSFRSVVSDSGANVGYIIAKKGFQSGAYEAAKNSNIILFTWKQFIDSYSDEWHKSKIKSLFELASPLKDYTSDLPFFKITYELDNMSKKQNQVFYDLSQKYYPISEKSRSFGHDLRVFDEVLYEKFSPPFVLNWPNSNSEVKLNCTTEYFEFLENICNQGIEEFDQFFGKKIRRCN